VEDAWQRAGQFWTPITAKTGSFLHADSQQQLGGDQFEEFVLGLRDCVVYDEEEP